MRALFIKTLLLLKCLDYYFISLKCSTVSFPHIITGLRVLISAFNDAILEQSSAVEIKLFLFGLFTITPNMRDKCFCQGFFFSRNNEEMVEGSGKPALNNTTTADKSILCN